MKRVPILVLAFLLVFALATSAMAANISVNAEPGAVVAGETVTVTVTLDEGLTVEEGSTAVQGKLHYDQDALTFTNYSLGDGYDYLSVANNKNQSYIGFSYVSVSNPQVAVAVPAGTVIALTFTANDTVKVAELEFKVEFGAANSHGEYTMDSESASAKITVCAGHTYNSDNVCTACGHVLFAIKTQPTTQKVKTGSTASFSVKATGEGLTYQWQYKTSSSGSWKSASGDSSKTSTLKLTASTSNNSYYYRCKITDSNGDVIYSNTVRLYVLSVTTQPTTQKVKTGSTASFSVSATGNGLTYQWQYKTSSSGSWKSVSGDSSKTATVKLTASTAMNGYYYRCKVTDSAGNVVYTDAVRLYVLGVTTQPTTQKVKSGTATSFSVKATGDGLTYKWQYKTSSSGSWKNTSSSSGKTATLTFTPSTDKNGYYYRCKITDSAGNVVYTDAVRLYVLGVTTQPTTQKVKSGTTTSFSVKATGDGLTYKWQYKTSSSGSWKNTSSSSGKTATLKFTPSTDKNGYYYRCKITDSAGNVVYTDAVRLYVLGVKTQPTTQKVKNGATTKFTVSATGDGLTYQWQYKTSSSGSWKNTKSSSGKTATLKFTASTAKNGYYYRCKITDSAGNVVYTDAVRLYVLGVKTQPTNKTVSSGKTAKFTVEATGSGLTYQWQYKTSSSGSWKNTKSSSGKTATLSFTASSAKNGYYYRCKITDSAGNVIYTDAVKLTVK